MISTGCQMPPKLKYHPAFQVGMSDWLNGAPLRKPWIFRFRGGSITRTTSSFSAPSFAVSVMSNSNGV